MAAKKTASTRTRGKAPADVDFFLANLVHPFKPEILALRTIIRGTDKSVREAVKWNAPSFHTKEHFATFHLRHKSGVQLVLHLGAKTRADANARAKISDPESLLEWRGADRATVTFLDLPEIHARKSAFVKVLRQWIKLV
jgi:hypothetical protein